MQTRREVVLGGLLTIIWGSGRCACAAAARRGRHTFGCLLEPDEAEPFLATAGTFQQILTGEEPIVGGTGNRDFDAAFARNMARLGNVLQVSPAYGYYDDVEGPNALATSVRRIRNTDGTVLFGKRLFLELIELPEHPDVGVAAVCAHEYAHILQHKLGINARLNAGQATVKRQELHADFLAGYFAGIRRMDRPEFPAAVFAVRAFALGDNEFNSRDHHGTSEMRAGAVVRGFDVAFRERRNLSEAVQIGANFVSRM
jgi:hypothetical protein